MPTLKQILETYCTENKKEIPYGSHLNWLGMAVSNHVKNIGKFELVNKKAVMEEMVINDYPEELQVEINEIISRFFSDPFEFIAVAQHSRKRPVSKPSRFNYIIASYKANAFETACTNLGVLFEKNEGFNNKFGKVQYILTAIPYQELINLGKAFQKERQLEKRRHWEQNARKQPIPLDEADIIPPTPVEAAPPAATDDRKPTLIASTSPHGSSGKTFKSLKQIRRTNRGKSGGAPPLKGRK